MVLTSRKNPIWQERGGLRGSRAAENVPLEHALWIRGQVDRERSTRNREGGHSNRDEGLGARFGPMRLFRDIPGGRVYGVEESIPISSIASALPSARVGFTGCPVCRAFPLKSSRNPSSGQDSSMPACSKAGLSSSETPQVHFRSGHPMP